MARFKAYSYGDINQIAASIDDMLEIDPIAFTIHYVVDEKMDRSVLEARYHNDVVGVGAPAYDPAILLKLIRVHSLFVGTTPVPGMG